MHIDEHGWIDSALRVPSPHRGGEIRPLAVLNHWTAGFSATTSVKVLEDRGLCAQLVGPRDGGLIQTAPLHSYGAHAGVSSWRGMSSCSRFMIGIEWANLGPVFWDNAHQRWFTGYYDKRTGRSIPYSGLDPVAVDVGDRVSIQHHGGYWQRATHFEPFSPLQIEAAEEVHHAIAERYPTVVAATDHATVAPERKVDCIPWQGMIADWGRVFDGRMMDEPRWVAGALEREGVNYRRVQEVLNRHGFYGLGERPLRVDGLMGPNTHRAIERFQRTRGLLPVGVLNDETLAELGIRL